MTRSRGLGSGLGLGAGGFVRPSPTRGGLLGLSPTRGGLLSLSPTRRVFFSFHYQRDIWRVQQVKNHWVAKPNRASAGYFDGSLTEKAKKEGDLAIKRLINAGMKGSSVTCVLVGADVNGGAKRDHVGVVKRDHRLLRACPRSPWEGPARDAACPSTG